ncbi:hypothetical protein C0992_008130 [Termitomyces sp. T32_za158]|nr:hypothetical protein C0992_008130 [Termitomyces sp. T32_za158]
MHLNMNGMRLGPLPRKKTAVHVFGDFLAYLYRCTRDFITDTHGNGAQLWNAVEHNIQFVLSHPNGWEGPQQSKMRRSAVYGGLIPDTNEGKARIRFVTEGEASLHACVLNGLAADVLLDPSKHGFLIADAGGGTLDISAYAIRGTAPLVMEEIAPPDCKYPGCSTKNRLMLSQSSDTFLLEKLRDSKYGTPAALDHITQRFDETTKRLFRERKDLQFIPFGSPLDKDLSVGIRAGQLKLTGNEGFRKPFRTFRRCQLQERLAPFNVTVSRPDTQTSKAVADGAVGFFCDHHVSARMSKFMYGVEFLRELDPSNPDHVARKERLCELPSGPKLLPDAFDCILNRGVKVKESTVFTRKYCTELTSLSMLSVFEVEIWCYRGGNVIPEWIDRQADDFSTLCVVRADLSPLSGSAEPKTGQFRSEPASRARTPIEPHYHPSSSEIRGFGSSPATQPPTDVASVHRTPSVKGHMSPSHTAAADLSRDLSLNIEPEKVAEPAVTRERTPSLAPSPLATSSSVVPPDLSRSLEPEVVTPVETASPRDKKGKGKKKTPTTPKVEETLQPVEPIPPAIVPEITPKVEETITPLVEPMLPPKTPPVIENLSSSLWTTDPATEQEPASGSLWGSTSPVKDKLTVTPKAEEVSIAAEKRLSSGWSSTAPSVKGTPAELPADPVASKASPVIGTGVSPIMASEPAIVTEVATAVAPSTPSPLTGKAAKKAKKKGASASTTPVAQNNEPPSVQAADSSPAAGVEDVPASEVPNESKDEPVTSTAVEKPIERPSSNSLTPIGLPEVTLSTKTPEPTPLTISDEVRDSTSSLFGPDAWGSSTSDAWAAFDKPKTPKSRPKTPVAEVTQTEETSSGTPDAASPETKSAFGWGAVAKTPSADSSKSTGLGWGASSIKKSAWGTSGTTTPISTTSGWGSSFGSAAKSPSVKSAWGSKVNTPTTANAPSSPWGAKRSPPVEAKEDSPQSKEESKEELKEELKEESKEESKQESKDEPQQEPKDEPKGLSPTETAPADTIKSETPTAEVMKTDDKVPTPEPSGTDPQEVSTVLETDVVKATSPKPTESELKADAPQSTENKQPTPQPSPKPLETPLDSNTDAVAEPEATPDPVTPGVEENDAKEEDKETKAGAGGGAKKGAAKKKKKKK